MKSHRGQIKGGWLPPWRGTRHSGWQAFLGACGVMMIALSAQAAQPVQARTAQPAQPKPGTPPATEEMVIVRSVFEDVGKDPFFPKSERGNRQKAAATAPVELPDLVLKGISVMGNRRLAMINNCTLAPGEEAEIRVGGRVHNVRCVEVRDKSVVITYKGVTKELALRPGL